MKIGMVGLCAVMLAGCSSGVPVRNEVSVSGSRFGNVSGEARLTVRSFRDLADGSRREVIGASCNLESTLFSASFATPARLKLPNFGPQSPELEIDCAAGTLAGHAIADIDTYWRRPPGGYGYGYYGGPWYGGPYGYWDWPGYGGVPVSDYPDVRVLLR
jgi:hypothetical protein